MNKKHFLWVASSIIIISLAWIVITPLLNPGPQADAIESAPHPGFFAPAFTLETPAGEIQSLSDHQGNPVLVFFWTSWCSVCKAAMPRLEAVYQEFEPLGFVLLAVNATNQDTLASAETYFKSQGYSFTLLLDRDGTVASQYQMRAVPTSVLIDAEGIVTDVVIGSGISEGFLRARLTSLIAGAQE